MRTRWKAQVQARKREEAEVRQAAYDALSIRQKIQLVDRRRKGGYLGAAKREMTDLILKLGDAIKT